jgi:hypothetical protein
MYPVFGELPLADMVPVVLLTEAWHRYMTASRFTSWIVDQMART